MDGVEQRAEAQAPSGTITVTLGARPSTVGSLGCWFEGVNDYHALAEPHIDRSLTINRCQFRCFGYKYFGVEDGQECYCGNAIMNGAIPADMIACNTPCVGNRNEICGGRKLINIYQVSPFAPPGQPRVVAFDYEGCYSEPPDGRALTKLYTSQRQTQESCLRDCAYGGFAYAALEQGTDCWCGNTLAPGTVRVRKSDCTFPCSGDAYESCGGARRLAVFSYLGGTLMQFPPHYYLFYLVTPSMSPFHLTSIRNQHKSRDSSESKAYLHHTSMPHVRLS